MAGPESTWGDVNRAKNAMLVARATAQAEQEYKNKIFQIKQLGKMKDTGIKAEVDKRTAKREQIEKQNAEAGQPKEAPPVATPFKLQDGDPDQNTAVQVSQDSDFGEPSSGGGGLGANVKAAMAGVPEGLTTTETTWAPHKTASGWRGMPTQRTRTTPTGMTQAQAGTLAMRRDEMRERSRVADERNRIAEARNSMIDANSQREAASKRRDDIVKYTKLFGNYADGEVFATLDPEQIPDSLKDKATKLIEEQTGRKMNREDLDDMLNTLGELRLWQASFRKLDKKAKAGLYKNIGDIKLDELVMDIRPLETVDDQQKAMDQLQTGHGRISTYLVSKGGVGGFLSSGTRDFKSDIRPETLWVSVGMPAAALNKMIVSRSGGNGYALEDPNKIFNLLDIGAGLIPGNKAEARARLKDMEVVSSWNEDTGLPREVTEGPFSQTSKEYLKSFGRREDILTKNPHLRLSTVTASTVSRREEQEALNPVVNKAAIGMLQNILQQSIGVE